uniref:Uncharacterized protein n=1 Tax=Caenorhabditis japonica TaxID=281687 RepID=A0A8R1ENJ7_CAEJA
MTKKKRYGERPGNNSGQIEELDVRTPRNEVTEVNISAIWKTAVEARCQIIAWLSRSALLKSKEAPISDGNGTERDCFRDLQGVDISKPILPPSSGSDAFTDVDTNSGLRRTVEYVPSVVGTCRRLTEL